MVRNKHSNTWKPPILGTILSNICFPSNSILNITSNTLVYIAWSTSRNKWGISSSLIISSDRFITANITFMSVGGVVIGWRYLIVAFGTWCLWWSKRWKPLQDGMFWTLLLYDERRASNQMKFVNVEFELQFYDELCISGQPRACLILRDIVAHSICYMYLFLFCLGFTFLTIKMIVKEKPCCFLFSL